MGPMHLECSLNRKEAYIVLVVFLPQIVLLSCKVISRLPFQIHEKPHIVPHIVVLLDMYLEVDIESIELLAIDVTNKTPVLSVMLYFLVGSSES